MNVTEAEARRAIEIFAKAAGFKSPADDIIKMVGDTTTNIVGNVGGPIGKAVGVAIGLVGALVSAIIPFQKIGMQDVYSDELRQENPRVRYACLCLLKAVSDEFRRHENASKLAPDRIVQSAGWPGHTALEGESVVVGQFFRERTFQAGLPNEPSDRYGVHLLLHMAAGEDDNTLLSGSWYFPELESNQEYVGLVYRTNKTLSCGRIREIARAQNINLLKPELT